MKNSIHNFYTNKHAGDTGISFEESFPHSLMQTQQYRKGLLPWAIAACLVIGIFILRQFEATTSSFQSEANISAAAQNSSEQSSFSGGRLEIPFSSESTDSPLITEVVVRGSSETTLNNREVAVYPQTAMDEGIEGWNLVLFTVTATGAVINAEVVDASPARIFNEASLAAIDSFTFNPRIENGVAVPVENVRYLFRFSLED